MATKTKFTSLPLGLLAEVLSHLSPQQARYTKIVLPQVSKALHSLTIPLLYFTVKLTSPSTLSTLLELVSRRSTRRSPRNSVSNRKRGNRTRDHLKLVERLIIDHFPSAEVCEDVAKTVGTIGLGTLFPNVKTVMVSQEAMIELFLRPKDDVQALYESVTQLAALASPSAVELASIDHLYNPKGKNVSAMDIVDSLVEEWLEQGLVNIIRSGPTHRARRDLLMSRPSVPITIELRYTNLTESILCVDPSAPRRRSIWNIAAPLRPYDSISKKSSFLADQVYTHAHILLSSHIKKSSLISLKISCPEFDERTTREVAQMLLENASMGIGGRADGLIGVEGEAGKKAKVLLVTR